MSWTNDMEVEPDSLEKIRETIVGALVPMIDSMLPEPTEEQLWLIVKETSDLHLRSCFILDNMRFNEDTDGDDANTNNI